MIVFQDEICFQDCVLWSTGFDQRSASHGDHVGEQPSFLSFMLEAVGQGKLGGIEKKVARSTRLSMVKINSFWINKDPLKIPKEPSKKRAKNTPNSTGDWVKMHKIAQN